MSNLRRAGGTRGVCFITCVTYRRRPILSGNQDLFAAALETVRQRIPFHTIAHVLLPDHFHLLLDPHENDFTGIMQRLKMSFGMLHRKRTGQAAGRVWQHRFWDHVIRDQQDLNRHIDYIHYNPVKHRMATSPFDWSHSSFHQYYESGYYTQDWGRIGTLRFDEDYGE